MRYIDSGTRDPSQTLGGWLAENLADEVGVAALRWQTGFFSADALGFLAPAMAALGGSDGVLHVLVGSNDGTTTRADIAALLACAGPARPGRRIGVVNFVNAYFHPKTVHIARGDGSQAAYVGSANLTRSGAASLHVEAAITGDTREGDDAELLHDIAAAVDRWFEDLPSGLFVVQNDDDMADLVARGVLNVPRPARSKTQASAGGQKAKPSGSALVPLVAIPALPLGVAEIIAAHKTTQPPEVVEVAEEAQEAEQSAELQVEATVAEDAMVAPPAMVWSKKLSASDAQRKKSGNQRGSITLVDAGNNIPFQTWFRFELFAGADWQSTYTSTGEVLEVATIPFDVTMLSSHRGVLAVPVSYAPNRQSDQNNYTSLLHLGPLADAFAQTDMTGRVLSLVRTTTGVFQLTIA